jgi:hypothetical protein
MEIKDILAALKTELLSEEQQAEIQQQITDLVDLKVQDKLNEALETEKENLIAVYEEKFEEYKQDITSKFSDFVDTILEQEMVIPEELQEFARKGELYSDLIEEFKVRIGIDEGVIQEEAKSLLAEAREAIVDLRDELNTEVSASLEAKSDAKALSIELYKRSKCEGLTESQRKSAMSLLEGVDKPEDIDRKFEVIVKHYLNEKDDETDDETNPCECPECGKAYNVSGACNTNKCDECDVSLKEKKASEGLAEVKTDKVLNDAGSPFDDYKKNVLKILKESKF